MLIRAEATIVSKLSHAVGAKDVTKRSESGVEVLGPRQLHEIWYGALGFS